MCSKLPEDLKFKVNEIINEKVLLGGDDGAAPHKEIQVHIFNFHMFPSATFRSGEKTLYMKLGCGVQLLKAIGNPKLGEVDIAKIVSLILFVHAGGREESTV